MQSAARLKFPALFRPAGKAMFQMLGVFAEFERAIIRERVVAGMVQANAKGERQADRPAGNPSRAACGHPRCLRSRRSWPASRYRTVRC